MTTENQPKVRYRININRLAKGQLSFDCTVELEAKMTTYQQALNHFLKGDK